jgi:hypothetical protein
MLIAWVTNPISPLIAGLLGDYVLEPAMRAPSGFSSLFGWLIPTGPGAGMGLLIFISSLGGILAGLAGYLNSSTRNAESILPDHDVFPKQPPTLQEITHRTGVRRKCRRKEQEPSSQRHIHPSSFRLHPLFSPTHSSSTKLDHSAIHSRHAFAILMRKEINHEQKFIS